MKKQFINVLRHLSLAMLTAVALVACVKDDPKKPDNEREKKLHEDPVKAVFTLTEATLPSDVAFDYAHLSKIALTQNKQVITFEQKKSAAFELTEGSPEAFTIKTQEQDPSAVYQLTVQYFNASGTLMNNQFIDNDQDKIHQHFFSLYKNKMLVRNKEEVPYEYLYADKDKSGEYMGEKNPIGLEGFFRFTKAIGKETVNVDFRHFYQSKFGNNGKISPFYAPSRETVTHSDLDVSLKLQFNDGTSSSATDSQDDKEDEKDNGSTLPVVSTDSETNRFPGINTTKVRKIKLWMYEGHIHAPASFHYVPGPTGFHNKLLGMEQEMTLEYRSGAWEVVSGANFFLFNKSSDYGEPIPAPVYGLWVEYYDASDELINYEFAVPGAYQTFFTPKDIKRFSSGESTSITPEQLVGYMYRDTKPSDKSTKEGAHFIDETDPTGLKGFFYFKEENVRFALNLELWQTPRGKKGTDGKLSTALKPSEHVQATGKPVLSVSLPVYIWLSRNHTDNIEGDTELSSLEEQQQAILRKLAELLKTDWSKIRADIDRRFYGARGDDSGGRWF